MTLNRPAAARPEPRERTSAFAEHLRRHAHDYFPNSGSCTPAVTLEWKEVRRGSTLYGFQVAMGAEERRILIKVLPMQEDQEPRTGDPAKDRPRLIRTLGLEPELQCQREYEALTSIHDRVHQLQDPRFDAIPVYDALPADRAIVMELVPRPSLRDLVGSPWRPGSSSAPEPASLFRNAGAWLEMYHGLSRPEPLTTLHSRSADFVDFSLEVTEFLSRVVGPPAFFRRVAGRIERAARTILPEALPLGLAHGDYAMRNVLVGPEGAVAVIDTKAGWRTAIYQDIGYFLTDLKCNAVQVFTRGAALGHRARLYEGAFLEGYFGPRVPLAAVRLYEIQACLDKWASIAARRTRAESLGPRFSLGLRLRFTSHHFRKVIEARLCDLPD